MEGKKLAEYVHVVTDDHFALFQGLGICIILLLGGYFSMRLRQTRHSSCIVSRSNHLRNGCLNAR